MWQLKNKEKVKTRIQNLRANFFFFELYQVRFSCLSKQKRKKTKKFVFKELKKCFSNFTYVASHQSTKFTMLPFDFRKIHF